MIRLPKWLMDLCCCFCLIVLGLIVFRSVIFSPNILMTTDDGLGAVSLFCQGMPGNFTANWGDHPLAGFPYRLAPLNWTNLWYWWLSPRLFMNWIHVIDLWAGSLFIYFFMRRFRIRPVAALLTAIAAFWVGSNLTLTYAGHVPKFAVMAFAAAAALTTTWLTRHRVLFPSLLFAAFLGLMISEQQDIGLFCAMPLGAYYLFRVIYLKINWRRLLPVWLGAGLIALLIASSSLLSGYMGAVKGVAALQQSDEERWNFATQWSWPPEESIDFVAPGFTGWRSGEPDGPYWGRMGRSEGWEKHHQGFMNFKLENTYLGFIPVIFAFFAVYAALRRKTEPSSDQDFAFNPRAEIIFWSLATLLTLLLAFGKHFPLYRLFFALPVINNIRNPNKFLQIFQICAAILSGWGLHTLLTQAETPSDTLKKALRLFVYLLSALCGWFAIWWLIRLAGKDAASLVQQGWGNMAAVIAGNKTSAVAHALLILAATSAAFWFIYLGKQTSARLKIIFLSALVAIAALDACLLSRHYIATMPESWHEENAVTRTLKSNLDHHRVAMLSQDGFYNIWLTYLLPYHQIPAFNFTQMPRMPEEYRLFLSALQRDPIRMWRLSGVNILLLPRPFYEQIIQQPGMARLLQPLLWYDVQPLMNNNLAVVPAREISGGSHVVLKFADQPDNRYSLVAGSRRFPTEEAALAWLAGPDYRLLEQVAVTGEEAPELPGTGRAGSVVVKEYSMSAVTLEVEAQTSCILRCADRYDPDWVARLNNGEIIRPIRTDFCMSGYLLPPGRHTVELAYRPSRLPLYTQLLGLFLLLAASLGAGVRRWIRLNKGAAAA